MKFECIWWLLQNDADIRVPATHFGLGKHIWDVRMTTYTPQYLWVSAPSI